MFNKISNILTQITVQIQRATELLDSDINSDQ